MDNSKQLRNKQQEKSKEAVTNHSEHAVKQELSTSTSISELISSLS